jgi:hypothetical protein
VSQDPLTPGALAALLERLRLPQAGAGLTPEAARAQADLLLARIASLTEALRAGEANETTRLASRLLLSDLALVAAQFRGRANEVSRSLNRVLDEAQATLEKVDATGSSQPRT